MDREQGTDQEASKPSIRFDDFAKLDLRVARIIRAEPHPNADRLLKLQIDLGDEQRQICAGIRSDYDPETLAGRLIVVVANLEPRTLRGETSQGMLLAATVAEEGGSRRVVLLGVPEHVPAGSAIG